MTELASEPSRDGHELTGSCSVPDLRAKIALEARMDALRVLEETDEIVRSSGAANSTLAPDRDRPSSLKAIGEKLLSSDVLPDVAEAFAAALKEIATAHVDNFPQNLFADFDYLARQILEDASAAGDGAADSLRASSRKIVRLLELYGGASEIRFQYVHDFLYGFDWAKWVALDPSSRSGVRPFGDCFLDHMERRGVELERLALADDARFPKVPEGQFRNAFGFRRNPANEAALFEDLALRGYIPLEAWRSDAAPVWDRPFVRLREERAVALGLYPA